MPSVWLSCTTTGIITTTTGVLFITAEAAMTATITPTTAVFGCVLA